MNVSNFNSSGNSFFRDTNLKFQKTYHENEFQMKSMSSLDTIQYSNQLILNEEWDALSKSIANNPSANSIELSGININAYGLRALGEIIRANSNIKTLKLEWNYLNENNKEFDYFCDCLSRSNLVYLYLNNNKIGSNLASSIGKLITSSSTLMYIDLRWNDITNDGAKAILNGLSKNNTIQELYLIGNKISEDLIRELNNCLQRNKMYSTSMYRSDNAKPMIEINTNSFANTYEVVPPSPRKMNINLNENIPLTFLEKEKEVSDEFKARYDVQLIVNAKLEKRVKELEIMIDLERAKKVEVVETYEKEFKNEKDLRIKYEEQIRSLREELVKTTVERNKYSERIEINKLSYEQSLDQLTNEKDHAEENLERANIIFEEKYNILKEEYTNNLKLLQEGVENLKAENERLKRLKAEEMKNNTRDFERKYKKLEDDYQKLKYQRDEIEEVRLSPKFRIIFT